MPAPGQFLPRRSGAHRIACIALYRALLIQCPKIPLPDDIQFSGPVNPIKHFIRKRFKKNAFHASPRIVVPALKTGYAAEQLLRSAAEGHATSISQIHDMLRVIHAQSTHSRSITPPMPAPPPKPAPYPGAPKVLDSRPLPLAQLSGGRRHVPILTYADHIPFLRFKKPQSPFLARVIRQKLATKQKRLDLIDDLDEQIAIGEHEDKWEENLRRPFGVKENSDMVATSRPEREAGNEREGEVPWLMNSYWSRGQVYKKMGADIEKAQKLGVKMLEVVDREKELWEAERKQRRWEKSQMKWRRREERRAGSEEGSLPKLVGGKAKEMQKRHSATHVKS